MLARFRDLNSNPHRAVLLRAAGGSIRPRKLPRVAAADLEWHLEATYRWLCAAQDATPDGGVAGFYSLWTGAWSESYPETTGYIIPTLLALAEARSDDEAYVRAMRMADWLCEVQMEDGAMLSGLLGIRRGAAVFNTGQAIFGWISAYSRSREERYAEAARRASDWLLRRQSSDGAWRGNLSVMTHASVNAYNGRCAWALAYAAAVLGEQRFADAARRASDWVLEQQNEVGWFASNAFSEDESPLLHTISYVIEGLVGVYAFSGETRYLEAAIRALDPLVTLARAGRLNGRLDEQWRPTVRWRCPTGEAQVAIVLHRLALHSPGEVYRRTAASLIGGLASVQLALSGGTRLTAGASPAVGGLPGSSPLWGPYMRFGLPNWAAKFFLDALLLETTGLDELSFPAQEAQA